MKKIDNKGFMLVEVLIVSVFVATVLTVLFIQFKKINNNYKTSFKYDTVEALYLINNVKNRFVTANDNGGYNLTNYKVFVQNEKLKYENILNPINISYTTNDNYFLNLLKEANIKNLYIAKKDAKEEMLKDKNIPIELRDYIKYMRFKTYNSDYFLIAEFGNKTFASVNI